MSLRAEAIFDCESDDPQQELSFKKGDIITDVKPGVDDGWFMGKLGYKYGLFPGNYVKFFNDEFQTTTKAAPISHQTPESYNHARSISAPSQNLISSESTSAKVYRPMNLNKVDARKAIQERGNQIVRETIEKRSVSNPVGKFNMNSALNEINYDNSNPTQSLNNKFLQNQNSNNSHLLSRNEMKQNENMEKSYGMNATSTAVKKPTVLHSNKNSDSPEIPNRNVNKLSSSSLQKFESNSSIEQYTNTPPKIGKKPPILVSNQSYQAPALPSRSFGVPVNQFNESSTSSIDSMNAKKQVDVENDSTELNNADQCIPASSNNSLIAKKKPPPPPPSKSATLSNYTPGFKGSSPSSSTAEFLVDSGRPLKPSELKGQNMAKQTIPWLSSATASKNIIHNQQESANEGQSERPLRPSELKGKSAFNNLQEKVSADISPPRPSFTTKSPMQTMNSNSTIFDQTPRLPFRTKEISKDDHELSINKPEKKDIPPPLPVRPNDGDLATIPPRPSQHNGSNLKKIISIDTKRRYEKLFEQLDDKFTGNLDGTTVRSCWIKSGIDNRGLGNIWNLVDYEKKGTLNKEQFCIGMFLIDDRLRGFPIPEVLPPELCATKF